MKMTSAFGLFQFHKEFIRAQKQIHDVRSSQLGIEQLGKADSDTELSLVPVTISLALTQSWRTEEVNAQLLQGFTVNTELIRVSAKHADAWRKFNLPLH